MRKLIALAVGLLAFAALPASAEMSAKIKVVSLELPPPEALKAEASAQEPAAPRPRIGPVWVDQIPLSKGWFGYNKLPKQRSASRLWAHPVVFVNRPRVTRRPLSLHPPRNIQVRKISRNEITENMLGEMKGRALTQGLLAVAPNLPYAGNIACVFLTYGTWLADDWKRLGPFPWTPIAALLNIPLSTKNCILPIDAMLNSKTPIEFLLVTGDGIAPYVVVQYGLVPWFVRHEILKQVIKAANQATAHR